MYKMIILNKYLKRPSFINDVSSKLNTKYEKRGEETREDASSGVPKDQHQPSTQQKSR